MAPRDHDVGGSPWTRVDELDHDPRACLVRLTFDAAFRGATASLLTMFLLSKPLSLAARRQDAGQLAILTRVLVFPRFNRSCKSGGQ